MPLQRQPPPPIKWHRVKEHPGDFRSQDYRFQVVSIDGDDEACVELRKKHPGAHYSFFDQSRPIGKHHIGFFKTFAACKEVAEELCSTTSRSSSSSSSSSVHPSSGSATANDKPKRRRRSDD